MNKAAVALLGVLTGALMHTGAAQAQASATTATPSRLDEIPARGILRACTTGDYKPHSFYRADGQFEGIDIEIGRAHV